MDRDFNTFDDHEEQLFLSGLRQLLKINGKITIVKREMGSVKLTMEMSPEDAKRVTDAFQSEKLKRYDIIDVRSLPADPAQSMAPGPVFDFDPRNFRDSTPIIPSHWRRVWRRYWIPFLLAAATASAAIILITYFPPKMPSVDSRFLIAATAIAAMILGLGAVFSVIDRKAGRVCDLETLSRRLRSDVYPIPFVSQQYPGRSGERRIEADRLQREQLIRQVDHLWYCTCGKRARSDGRRCLLVASAVASEGRTAIASQLAIASAAIRGKDIADRRRFLSTDSTQVICCAAGSGVV